MAVPEAPGRERGAAACVSSRAQYKDRNGRFWSSAEAVEPQLLVDRAGSLDISDYGARNAELCTLNIETACIAPGPAAP